MTLWENETRLDEKFTACHLVRASNNLPTSSDIKHFTQEKFRYFDCKWKVHCVKEEQLQFSSLNEWCTLWLLNVHQYKIKVKIQLHFAMKI